MRNTWYQYPHAYVDDIAGLLAPALPILLYNWLLGSKHDAPPFTQDMGAVKKTKEVGIHSCAKFNH